MLHGKRPAEIRAKVFAIAKNLKVKIPRFENVGNHLHLFIRVESHESYVKFIRGISSTVARYMTGAKKGGPVELALRTGFWLGRPFTRIVTWGQDLSRLNIYMDRNRIQAIGFEGFVWEKQQETG